MRLAELEHRWRASTIGTSGVIHHLVRRPSPGIHETPTGFVLSPSRGVVGDRWAARQVPELQAQVSMIERRIVELLTGTRDRWNLPGDNLVVDLDLSVAALPVGTRLAAGDAVLEITAKPHAGCDRFRERLGDVALRWVNDRAHRDRRRRGVYARILVGGAVRKGDRLVRIARS
jgi:MOSC domain-containing protein YiiM